MTEPTRQAVYLAQAFIGLRVRRWPEAPSLNEYEVQEEAQAFLDGGGTIRLAQEVFSRAMKGDAAPQGFLVYQDALERAVEHLKAGMLPDEAADMALGKRPVLSGSALWADRLMQLQNYGRWEWGPLPTEEGFQGPKHLAEMWNSGDVAGIERERDARA